MDKHYYESWLERRYSERVPKEFSQTVLQQVLDQSREEVSAVSEPRLTAKKERFHAVARWFTGQPVAGIAGIALVFVASLTRFGLLGLILL